MLRGRKERVKLQIQSVILCHHHDRVSDWICNFTHNATRIRFMVATGGFSTAASATRSVARHRQVCWLAKPTLAKLSLSRMIAAAVLRMWKNEEVYDSE